MKITRQQYETLIRRENPEVFTETEMQDWIIKSIDVINKGDMGELSESEKLDAEKFGSQYKSFVKVIVIDAPLPGDLNKGMKYTNLYMRPRIVDSIEKSIKTDEIEKDGK